MSAIPAPPEDLWRHVAPHIEAARQRMLLELSRALTASDYARMRARFIEGYREHGGDILGWPKMRFADEARQERDDAMIYGAVEEWLFPR